MRSFILLTALLAFGLAATSVSAGEISKDQLGAIGLPTMKSMPREQALQVRGKGIQDGGNCCWNNCHPCQSHCNPCCNPCHVSCGGGGLTAAAVH
jgi:hypothetical protein